MIIQVSDIPEHPPYSFKRQSYTRRLGSPWPRPDLNPAASQFYYLPGIVLQVKGWGAEFQNLSGEKPLTKIYALTQDRLDFTARYVQTESAKGLGDTDDKGSNDSLN